jgi:hypothetical protein
VTFGFDLSEEATDYLIAAVDLVATHGWRMVPLYRFDETTGSWAHRDTRAGNHRIADLLDDHPHEDRIVVGSNDVYAEYRAAATAIFESPQLFNQPSLS